MRGSDYKLAFAWLVSVLRGSELGCIAEILPLEKQVDFSEVGPVGLVPLPAFSHQVVDLLGTVGWLGQRSVVLVSAVQQADVLDYLLVRQLAVRLVSGERQNFPHGHGERPHVALGRELTPAKTHTCSC
ncbi:hypothetical protein CEXT_339001 [Caerostris extrusa]|uniref:Secreted protein n=1 Tax=Caerostris extrusa TaxID=172846 RepID=A0AAV4V583_CAEEX|nr:hypothetical protein CEXT_339001 [Caerostris extrusa]